MVQVERTRAPAGRLGEHAVVVGGHRATQQPGECPGVGTIRDHRCQQPGLLGIKVELPRDRSGAARRGSEPGDPCDRPGHAQGMGQPVRMAGCGEHVPVARLGRAEVGVQAPMPHRLTSLVGVAAITLARRR